MLKDIEEHQAAMLEEVEDDADDVLSAFEKY